MEKLNELIELNLNLLSTANRNTMICDYFTELDGKDLHKSLSSTKFAEILRKNDLITFDSSNHVCTITEKGFEIFKNGGWLKHLENENKKKDIEIERQKLTDEKLKYDVKNSKRIFKTYWWTFAFSIIALTISLTLAILKLLEIFQ